MKLLTIDFETCDPFIGIKLGGGWTYAMNHPEVRVERSASYHFKDDSLTGDDLYSDDNIIHTPERVERKAFIVLGAGVRTHDCKYSYVTDMDELRDIVAAHDGLVMHNAMYDYGILMYLFPDLMRERDFFIYDTKIMVSMLQSNLKSYSLKSLASRYGVTQKSDDALYRQFFDLGLYTLVKFHRVGRKYTKFPTKISELRDLTYKNLNLLPESIVRDYCLDDVRATYEIFEKIKDEYDGYEGAINKDVLSKAAKICIEMRAHGVRVDLQVARKLSTTLENKYHEALTKLWHTTGKFNVNSPAQCGKKLVELGLPVPKKESGNYSVTKEWLENRTEDVCKMILDVKTYYKLKHSFVDKILEINDMLGYGGEDIGRIYSTLKIFGAAATGRFSCSEINLQQIPKRNPEMGPLIRSLFLPDEGELWGHADFAAQEPRLQVHYASRLGCPGGDEAATEWVNNPTLNIHSRVASMAEIERNEAKILNLGLSYNMGPGTVCTLLGLPTTEDSFINQQGKRVKYLAAGPEGLAIINKYNRMVPYLKELNKKCERQMKFRKKIRTLGGRYIKLPGKFEHRKGLNYLIQGSAADQAILSLVKAYDMGLKILIVVHDEINISMRDLSDLERLRIAMETSVKLEVPSVADVKCGPNWGECK